MKKKGSAWQTFKEQWLVILAVFLLGSYGNNIITWVLAHLWPINFRFGQFNLPNLTFLLISGAVTLVVGFIGFFLGIYFMASALAKLASGVFASIAKMLGPEGMKQVAAQMEEMQRRNRPAKPKQISRRDFLSPWRKQREKTANAAKPKNDSL